jgi:hypothetical protein
LGKISGATARTRHFQKKPRKILDACCGKTWRRKNKIATCWIRELKLRIRLAEILKERGLFVFGIDGEPIALLLRSQGIKPPRLDLLH